jgi:hypothetical protein
LYTDDLYKEANPAIKEMVRTAPICFFMRFASF